MHKTTEDIQDELEAYIIKAVKRMAKAIAREDGIAMEDAMEDAAETVADILNNADLY